MDSFHTIEMSDPRYEREGLRHVTVKSKYLQRRGDITVFIPNYSESTRVESLLILLHGVYGSHWLWSEKAGVHRTAQRLIDSGSIQPVVITMPSDGLWGDGSGYLPHGREDAERWIVEDVPYATMKVAPCLTDKPRIFIAGLSMGGYGALRLGAKYGDRFSGVSAHSAITDVSEMSLFVEEPVSEYLAADPQGTDLMFWFRQNRSVLPSIRFDCGVDDDLLQGNQRLHNALEREGIAHTYQEFPGGHEWAYWEKHVEETLRFLDTNAR